MIPETVVLNIYERVYNVVGNFSYRDPYPVFASVYALLLKLDLLAVFVLHEKHSGTVLLGAQVIDVKRRLYIVLKIECENDTAYESRNDTDYKYRYENVENIGNEAYGKMKCQ